MVLYVGVERLGRVRERQYRIWAVGLTLFKPCLIITL